MVLFVPTMRARWHSLVLALGLSIGAPLVHATATQAPAVHVAVAAGEVAPDSATVRRVFLAELAASHRETANEEFDVSIVSSQLETVRGMVELSVTMHVVVSDHTGKLHSFGSGTAKVQVPCHRYHASQLPALREQALSETASSRGRDGPSSVDSGRPPHRSERALLTHSAPTSGAWRESGPRDTDAGSSPVAASGLQGESSAAS
jgi:hypothetical protein